MDIDFVVLWVNGNDPEWETERKKYEKRVDDNNDVHRFRDWGIMNYWFRAVEQYAPWVRTIHFVTWGHLPPFLKTDHPKLHIVRHEDYMPRDALPCFNSCALEMNIHRIEGLAEHFVYFNDDMILNRPLPKEHFFDQVSGLPRNQFCELPSYFYANLGSWDVHTARDLSVINKWFPKNKIPWSQYFRVYFSRQYPLIDNLRTLMLRLLLPSYFSGFRIHHSCVPLLKSSFEAVWEREPDMLDLCTHNMFRCWDDVNQYLPQMWALASGQFRPCRINYLLSDITPDSIDRVCEAIVGKQYDSLCLNDPSGDIDFESLSVRLHAAFEKSLPEKCSFEK